MTAGAGKLRPIWGRGSLRVLGAALVLTTTLVVYGSPDQATAKSKGTLELEVVGLPKQVPAEVHVFPAGGGSARVIESSGVIRLPPGRWEVMPLDVKFDRAVPPARAGALGKVINGGQTYKVKAGKKTHVRLFYEVTNPEVRGAPLDFDSIEGSRNNPRSLIYERWSKEPIRVGEILISRPSDELPEGLLSKVTGVRARQGKWVVQLRPSNVSAAFPSIASANPLEVDLAAASESSGVGTCDAADFYNEFEFLSGFQETEITSWPRRARFQIELNWNTVLGPQLELFPSSCAWDMVRFNVRSFIDQHFHGQTRFAQVPFTGGIEVRSTADIGGDISAMRIRGGGISFLAFTLGRGSDFDARVKAKRYYATGSSSHSGDSKTSIGSLVRLGIGGGRAGNPRLRSCLGSNAIWPSSGECRAFAEINDSSASASIAGHKIRSRQIGRSRTVLWRGC